MMLCVPASSELRAETRVALPQPGAEVSTGRRGIRGVQLTRVLHRMQAPSGKNSHFSRRQGLAHHACTILLNHVSIDGSGNSNDEIGRSGMIVWWEHGAGSEVEHSHSHSIANDGWKGCCVSIYNGTRRIGVGRLSSVVEDPVAVG